MSALDLLRTVKALIACSNSAVLQKTQCHGYFRGYAKQILARLSHLTEVGVKQTPWILRERVKELIVDPAAIEDHLL